MITAVNDARIAAGKAPVGWANPAVRPLSPPGTPFIISRGLACGPIAVLGRVLWRVQRHHQGGQQRVWAGWGSRLPCGAGVGPADGFGYAQLREAAHSMDGSPVKMVLVRPNGMTDARGKLPASMSSDGYLTYFT